MAQGGVTAQAQLRACLDRIAARDAVVGAWSYLDPEQALAAARDADQAGGTGPLWGVPVGIKDVFLTRDMPTQYNAPQYRGFSPAIDAACVAILRARGAVLLGKTATVEFGATGRKPGTRNPHDVSRTPGGSSSGSAAAVADGQVPLALGTQTGGSISRPASYCGVFAMKPSWGFVSNEGARCFAPSLDTVGWFARDVGGLAAVYDAFDPDAAVHVPYTLKGGRIGWCPTPFWNRVEPAMAQAFERARRSLETAGARVDELSLPPPFETLLDAHGTIMFGEGRRSFLSEYLVHGSWFDEGMRAIAENAAGIADAEIIRALDVAASCRVVFDRLAGQYDAVIAPSAVGEAPPGLSATGDYAMNAMWTLLHVPCVNVPGLTGPAGMPLGMTVLAERGADRRVLAVAGAVKQSFLDGKDQQTFIS
jgi:Asp-tRNA(Asn)/Glu-tRNA(Gln) amidotransferase A subunit family amidase